MAKYTTEIRTVVESGAEIFDFEYPLFDQNYKSVLEAKIIDYYYFREIGFETLGQFKHRLKSKLNLIMPYYNKLYETEGLVTVDNYNINLDNTITKTNKINTETNNTSNSNTNSTTSGTNKTVSSSEDNSTTDSNGREVFSDTPQAKLANLDYATNLTDSESSVGTQSTATGESTVTDSNTGEAISTDTSTGKLTTIEEYTEHLLGNGSMRYNADILMEFRKSFLNIDKQIIEELNDLFMNVY